MNSHTTTPTEPNDDQDWNMKMAPVETDDPTLATLQDFSYADYIVLQATESDVLAPLKVTSVGRTTTQHAGGDTITSLTITTIAEDGTRYAIDWDDKNELTTVSIRDPETFDRVDDLGHLVVIGHWFGDTTTIDEIAGGR